MVLFLMLFGPLPEEMSWRGLGLPLLRRQHGPLSATLTLAVVWCLWHLPLFWLRGSYQWSIGLLTPGFWLYFVAVLSTSFLYTWMWETTASIPAAVLLHFAVNFSGEFFGPSFRADMIRTATYLVIAVLIAVGWTRTSLADPSDAVPLRSAST
jgi:membrane protease YdiL (CAAX protease family)